MAQGAQDDYLTAFRGSFTSALRWHDLDALWDRLLAEDDPDWYIYAVGEPPPSEKSSPDRLRRFIEEIDALLRAEHKEDYCGIVYADDLRNPALVKIYDPHNLGVSCGYSDNPPLPGWVLSRLPPSDLAATQPLPGSRRRWWRRLFE